MTSAVPPEFDKPWDMSDVIIRTNNSDGKDLHAFKGILATFSPYFRVLFFGDFKEKNEASVNVDCDYDVMLEILRNIHKIGYKYAEGQKPYSAKMLVKMYHAADRFDVPFLRSLCLDQLEGYASVEMAKAAGELKLFDLRMKILMKLSPDDVNKFLCYPNFSYSLTKEELISVYKKIAGRPLPKGDDVSKGPLSLEKIIEDLKNPRVDLTKPWPQADLVIVTNNARERLLYCNKTLVEMMCPKFSEYLCETDELQLEGANRSLALIKEEYVIMKEIMSIVHLCNTDYNDNRSLHPVLLHAMYRVADVKNLNIPLVLNFCVAKLKEHKSVDALDVLWNLNLYNIGCDLTDDMTMEQLRDWLYREDGHLCYHTNGHDVVVTPSKKKRSLWKELASWFIRKFKDHYFTKTKK